MCFVHRKLGAKHSSVNRLLTVPSRRAILGGIGSLRNGNIPGMENFAGQSVLFYRQIDSVSCVWYTSCVAKLRAAVEWPSGPRRLAVEHMVARRCRFESFLEYGCVYVVLTLV